MTLFLILFFLSLTGIIIMISRKLFLSNKIEIQENEETPLFETHNLQEIKQLIVDKSKIFGHKVLLFTLRLYIISFNFIKQRKNSLITKIREKINKNKSPKEEVNNEPSKFIKIVSDYKHKVRKMTHRIKREEGIE